VLTTLVACFQPPFTLIEPGLIAIEDVEPLPYRFGTATIPVRNRYHTSSIASEEVEMMFLVVKKGSMDGSVMSDHSSAAPYAISVGAAQAANWCAATHIRPLDG
jgi:hypothetical protein